jgi:hypothetical protein
MASGFVIPPKGATGLRRLSSKTATADDLTSGGPAVVVPERILRQQSQSQSQLHHGSFAASIEAARNELAAMNLEEDAEYAEDAILSPSISSPEMPSSPIEPTAVPTADTFAFAFDIDGVLIRGGRPIPEAIESMKILNGENEYGIRM